MTDVYVLQRVVVHDATYVEGVTLDREIADRWMRQNPFRKGVGQQEWNDWTLYAPEEEVDYFGLTSS